MEKTLNSSMLVMLELKRRNLRKTVKIVKKWKNVPQNMPNLEIFSERSFCIQHLLFFLFNDQLRGLLYLASALQIFFYEIGKMLILVQMEASVVFDHPCS